MEGPTTSAEEKSDEAQTLKSNGHRKAGLRAEPMIQIGGIKHTRRTEDEEMAVAE